MCYEYTTPLLAGQLRQPRQVDRRVTLHSAVQVLLLQWPHQLVKKEKQNVFYLYGNLCQGTVFQSKSSQCFKFIMFIPIRFCTITEISIYYIIYYIIILLYIIILYIILYQQLTLINQMVLAHIFFV